MNKLLLHSAARPLVFALSLAPFLWLSVLAATDGLGANPQETLIRSSGDWALRFVCIAMAVTPVRVMARLQALARWRRMLGLFAFFYASVHVLSYAVFDMGLDLAEILADIRKRPFILVGSITFVVLLALAVTSFNRALRWLGAARWQRLHRLIYVASLTAVLHFFWMRSGKSDFAEVFFYTAVVAVLLGWRIWRWTGQRVSS